MNRAALYHRPESEYAYLYDSNTVHLRLRTGKDVKAVEVLWGDTYQVDGPRFAKEAVAMKKVAEGEVHDFWQVSVHPPYHRLKYGFRVIAEDEEVFYGDRGCYAFEEQYYSIPNFYFALPYMHEIDAFHAPEWVKETVWYQIFPERFANGDVTNDPAGTLEWGSEDPTPHNFFGGDLQGVIDHLDYLQELGINGLYFCPIFKATSNHKYDTEDYFKVDPCFGEGALFKELVEQAHRRNMKVMIDAVFNHIGDHSPQWQDVLEKGEASQYSDWFHIHQFPVTYTETDNFEVAEDLTFDTFAFTPHMPKWNTANPKVMDYLLGIATYWIDEYDIDAWRLDVANEVDHHFWKKFHEACISRKPDFYMLGEIWHTSQPWLSGDEFTGVMNYSYCEAMIQYFNKKEISAQKMVSVLNEQLMLYRKQVNPMNLNVLDSHDTARIRWVLDGDVELEKQLFTFMMLQPGTPCIYYGTEIGMSGGPDPKNRACMIWDETKWDQDFLIFMKDLIQMRHTYQTLLADGEWQLFSIRDDLLKLCRKDNQTELIAYFNRGNTQSIDISDEIISANGYIDGKLENKGFVVIKK